MPITGGGHAAQAASIEYPNHSWTISENTITGMASRRFHQKSRRNISGS